MKWYFRLYFNYDMEKNSIFNRICLRYTYNSKIFVYHDGSKKIIVTNYTYNQIQIEWYNEGYSLNLIKK